MIDLDMKVIEKAVKYYFAGYSAKEAIRKMKQILLIV